MKNIRGRARARGLPRERRKRDGMSRKGEQEERKRGVEERKEETGKRRISRRKITP
jgi:hypothetical protein